jgi:predicted HAD superfamily Cof-like phosphohydrolase
VSKDWYSDLVDFHLEVMGDAIPKYPILPSIKVEELRKDLITEEVNELFEAMARQDIVKVADGIADAIVVLLGTAVMYGIDIRPVWDEVHATNMAKKGGPMRADGKRLKPGGWEPPKILEILRNQGAKLNGKETL